MKKDAPRSGLRYLVLLIALFFPVTGAWASVTIVGSRIIYPSTVASVDVQLKNNDDFPYIVQTWFDNGDLHIGPENASGIPFISTPPVFRIQPKSGQIVRVVYSQRKALPHDRESVFWFNALQVPPANIGGRQQNKVLVMLRTRIKLFYRPEGIGSPGNLAKKLHITVVRNARKGAGIVISNPQPWYASLSNLSVKV
ncbi:TPA: fimbrial chaperone, partial [Klebsiella pneumoniae]